LQHRGQAGAVEHVVAENESAAAFADELPPDDESLGEALRAGISCLLVAMVMG
jgi:hypothetical protein